MTLDPSDPGYVDPGAGGEPVLPGDPVLPGGEGETGGDAGSGQTGTPPVQDNPRPEG